MMAFLVILMAFLSIGAVVYVFFGDVLTGRSKVNKRMQAVSRTAKDKTGKSSGQENPNQRRKAVQDTLKELEEAQKAKKKKISLQTQIEQAGLTLSVRGFWIFSAVTGVLLIMLGVISGLGPIGIALMGVVGLIGLPRWFIGFATKRRQKKFTEEFANALDVIVRGVKAGLPLNECLQIIANESDDPVKGEFQALVDGQKVGVPLEQGLKNMFERMPIAEVNFFMIVLTIQQSTGGNLSEALGNLSNVLRSRKQMRGKIQAMSSEAKASALIIGSLPPGVMALVYLTTPDYILTLFLDPRGHLMLMGGVLWMTIGVLVMRKMINFNF